MIEWESYDDLGATQTAEHGDLLLLIRYIEEADQWAYVVGDTADAKLSGVTDTESSAKAIVTRYCWVVKNVTHGRALKYLL